MLGEGCTISPPPSGRMYVWRDGSSTTGQSLPTPAIGSRAELPGPHARRVDEILTRHVPRARLHASHAPPCARDARHLHPLHEPHAAPLRAACQRTRGIHRVDTPVVLHIEACDHVIRLAQREEPLHLRCRDLVHVDSALAVEGRHSPELLWHPVGQRSAEQRWEQALRCAHLEVSRRRRERDESHGHEAGGHAGLLLEDVRVQLLGVLAHLGRRLRERSKRDHEAGGVPRRPRRDPVPLQKQHVGPT
eukprot:scaffold81426_cov62-Phaeocystis_antarctica.AAC.4